MDTYGHREPAPPAPPGIVLAVVVVTAAAVTLFFAWLTGAAFCREGNSTSCPNGDPSGSVYAMVASAAGGLALSFAAAWAATHERPRLTRALVALTFAPIAASIVLMDLVTHGGRLEREPEFATALGALIALYAGKVALARFSRRRK